jgi:hypothetical protein
MAHYLAQVNIGHMVAPLNDPQMAGFVARLDEINALADASPGFVWRLQTPEGNATAVQAFEDELILFNLSVWTSLDDLSRYVYASESNHREVLKQRRRWFQRFDGPYMALWWIPQDHLPTVEEAKERLASLETAGATQYAFSFKKPFPPPEESTIEAISLVASSEPRVSEK